MQFPVFPAIIKLNVSNNLNVMSLVLLHHFLFQCCNVLYDACTQTPDTQNQHIIRYTSLRCSLIYNSIIRCAALVSKSEENTFVQYIHNGNILYVRASAILIKNNMCG